MEVPPDEQNMYDVQQRILSRAMFYFRQLLEDIGTASIPRPDIVVFKEDQFSNVATFTVQLKIDLNVLAQTGMDALQSRLKKMFTNSDVLTIFNKHLRIYGLLKSRFGDSVENVDPTSNIRVSQISDALDNQVSPPELALMFGSPIISGKTLQDLLVNNILTINIPIVYKRIFGKESKSAIAHEIEMYRAFADARFNTACALVLIEESPNSNVEYTLKKKMTLFIDIPNIFDASKGIFKLFMQELSRLHRQGLVHGDLNFKNVALANGILFFDLTYSSRLIDNPEALVGETLILCRNLTTTLRRIELSDSDKKATIEAIKQYLNEILGGIGIENLTGLTALAYNQQPYILDLVNQESDEEKRVVATQIAKEIRFHFNTVMSLLQ